MAAILSALQDWRGVLGLHEIRIPTWMSQSADAGSTPNPKLSRQSRPPWIQKYGARKRVLHFGFFAFAASYAALARRNNEG